MLWVCTCGMAAFFQSDSVQAGNKAFFFCEFALSQLSCTSLLHFRELSFALDLEELPPHYAGFNELRKFVDTELCDALTADKKLLQAEVASSFQKAAVRYLWWIEVRDA